MTSASSSLLIEHRDGLDILSLNRPGSLNAISPELAEEMVQYFDDLHSDNAVRVVLMRGQGRSFCSGLDLNLWEAAGTQSPVLFAMQMQAKIGNIMRRMRSCPQPIIALGHGAACGAGFSLLLAADVRFGTPDLRMNAAYIKIGLSGCDVGSSYFLPRLVGASIAAELILTGRFIDAERALRISLLSEVVAADQLLDTGISLAAEMLATSPMGLALTKQGLNLNIDAPSLEAAFALEDRQQVLLQLTQDHQEGLAAFREKRSPAYLGS